MKYATGYPRIRHNTVDSKANIRLLLNTEIYCEFNTLLSKRIARSCFLCEAEENNYNKWNYNK